MHPFATDDNDDDDYDAALDGDAARMWIRDALREYEQVAALCNAQSLLANAAAALASSSSSSSSSNSSHPARRPPPPDRADRRDECDAAPRTLDAELRRRDLHASFADYHAAIDDVRRTHASLRARLASCRGARGEKRRDVRDGDDDGEPGGGDRSPRRRRRRRPSSASAEEAFARHVELAERAIRTAMRAPPPHREDGGAGPGRRGGRCGASFENGIVGAPSPLPPCLRTVVVARTPPYSRIAVSLRRDIVTGGGGERGVTSVKSTRKDAVTKNERDIVHTSLE